MRTSRRLLATMNKKELILLRELVDLTLECETASQVESIAAVIHMNMMIFDELSYSHAKEWQEVFLLTDDIKMQQNISSLKSTLTRKSDSLQQKIETM